MAWNSVYIGRFGFVDEKGLKTYIEHELRTPTNIPFAALDLVAAQAAIEDLQDAYQAASSANVFSSTLRIINLDNATLGAAGSDVSDEAVLVAYINDTGSFEKTTPLRIPSPLATIFESNLKDVDLDDALVQALVDELDQSVFVSDGEEINGSLGNNGIKEGYWRSRPRTAGKD